jgi:serine protease AprX
MPKPVITENETVTPGPKSKVAKPSKPRIAPAKAVGSTSMFATTWTLPGRIEHAIPGISQALQQRMGARLRSAVGGLASGARPSGMTRTVMDGVIAADTDLDVAVDTASLKMPLSISLPSMTPKTGEKWQHYKQRVADKLGPIADWLKKNAGLNTEPSYAAGAFSTRAIMGQMEEAVKHKAIKRLELDPPRIATLMDNVSADIELPLFRSLHPGIDGSGVRLAVLDSGIDLKHPWLQVAASFETCGESVNIPGSHGTHVAGIIASRDAVYQGVAPGVSLINVKVLDRLGRGTAGMITRGVDKALDAGAQILSMSLGFNHLPTWSPQGHGWQCPDGRCELCRAVDNAVALDGVFVVVAAGNSHREAETLRQNGDADSFDSEISCPGSANAALTVGAITKQTFLSADFSSRGPTAFGSNKPDIAAPGVNIRSAALVARDVAGNIPTQLLRADLNIPMSGTSMATPVVAGAVALILQHRIAQGLPISVGDLRAELLVRGFRHLGQRASEVGVGRLNLAGI